MALLDELVQKIRVIGDTKAYDTLNKKQKVTIANNKLLANSFRSAFSVFAGAVAVRSLARYADTWTDIESTLKLVTNSDQERLRVQEQLFKIAQETRQEMGASVDLYRRIAISAKSLGLSEEDRLSVVENISKSLTVGGGSAASQQAALFQLGQGLASGQLRGQELNSILEQTPRLAQMIAEGMGIDVGQLRETAMAGSLTPQEVIKAILNQTQQINKEFAKMKPTIYGSLVVLNNAFGKFISGSEKAAGFSEMIANAIMSISKALSNPTLLSAMQKITGMLGLLIKNFEYFIGLYLGKKLFGAFALFKSSTVFGYFMLELKSGLGLMKSFQATLIAMNFTGFIKSAGLAALAFAKWAIIIGLLIEAFDTLRGKDTYTKDIWKKYGPKIVSEEEGKMLKATGGDLLWSLSDKERKQATDLLPGLASPSNISIAIPSQQLTPYNALSSSGDLGAAAAFGGYGGFTQNITINNAQNLDEEKVSAKIKSEFDKAILSGNLQNGFNPVPQGSL